MPKGDIDIEAFGGDRFAIFEGLIDLTAHNPTRSDPGQAGTENKGLNLTLKGKRAIVKFKLTLNPFSDNQREIVWTDTVPLDYFDERRRD